MTLDSTATTWVAIAILGVFVVAVLLIWRRPSSTPFEREQIIEQTRQAVQEAAQQASAKAQQDAADDFRRRQDQAYQEQAAKRKESAARAQQTKAKKIESLRPWREQFVTFVRGLAEPRFREWNLDDGLLDRWAEERADVYISRRPYVLEIVQSIHADAQRAAESYANNNQKSPREMMRERAKTASRNLVRNANCPYCGVILDENAHFEHIIPVKRGGTNDAWNTVFICVPCNRAKSDLSLIEFVETDYAKRKHLRLSEIVRRLKELDKFVEVMR